MFDKDLLKKKFVSADCVKKLDAPILTKDDMPYPSSLVFNAGVIKFKGKYVMAFRNDYGITKEEFEGGKRGFNTTVGIAFSDNGIDGWRVVEKPLFDSMDNVKVKSEIRRYSDPRLTVVDGVPYLSLALDSRHGIHGVFARLNDDFTEAEIISTTVPDNRNMVLFPEKVNGYFTRLERPMPVYGRGDCDRFDLWLSQSPDLVFWGKSRLVLGVEHVPYANDKIGPAAPPVKTEKGWLATFHAVDLDTQTGKNGWEECWQKRYTAGIMLLDLNDPSKIIAKTETPFIAADRDFENENGFRCDVIFPGGMILEDDREVKIYYGSADTVECLATAKLDDIFELLGV